MLTFKLSVDLKFRPIALQVKTGEGRVEFKLNAKTTVSGTLRLIVAPLMSF